MSESEKSRREFLKITGLAAGAALVSPRRALTHTAMVASHVESASAQNEPSIADYALHIRRHGMGIVVEYAGGTAKAQWIAPPPFKWTYSRFAKPGATAASPDETVEMTFAKDNAAEEGFNRWTINGAAYPTSNEMAPASFHLKQGKRYRIRMRNASDDIHPIHLHRHSFELTSIAEKPMAGVLKDVFILLSCSRQLSGTPRRISLRMRLGRCLPANRASVIRGERFAHCRIRLTYRLLKPDFCASSPTVAISSATIRSCQPDR